MHEDLKDIGQIVEQKQLLRIKDLDETTKLRIIEPYFDAPWYLGRNRDVKESGIDPAVHYLRHGDLEARDPSPLFCTTTYFLKNPFVKEQGICSLVHWVLEGLPKGVKPDPVFYEEWLENNHFEVDIMRAEFDAAWYSAQNPDVTPGEELVHFAKYGWLEGRDPSPDFSTRGYLAANEDVRAAKINPFFHWLTEGRREGRQFSSAQADSNLAHQIKVMDAHFDEDFYRSRLEFEANRDQHPRLSLSEVREMTRSELLLDYATEGWKEGRDPNRAFSTSGYLSIYTDVREALINPFYHWLVQGAIEGRQSKPQTDYRCTIISSLKDPSERIKNTKRFADHQNLRKDDVSILIGEIVGQEYHITVSHDNYQKSVGGIQLLLRRAALEYKAAGLGHIHVFPAHSTLIYSEDNEPTWGVIFNGEFAGYIDAISLCSALNEQIQRRSSGSMCSSVVVHSLLGHCPSKIESLLTTAQARRHIFWVHDYASVCAGFQLLRNDVEWCGAPQINSNACQICIHSLQRRNQHKSHGDLFAKFSFDAVAPSNAAALIFAEHHPYVPLSTKPHLMLTPASKKRRKAGPITVAFLGHPAAHKGWFDFVQLSELFAGDAGFDFVHIATNAPELPGIRYVEAAPGANGESTFAKTVDSENVDVAFVASLWPETFCLVAFEAIAGGATIATYAVSGNVADLAAQAHGVVAADLKEAAEIIRTFSSYSLANEKQLYEMCMASAL